MRSTTDEILEYLSGRTNYETEKRDAPPRLSLAGVSRLLERLGHPETLFRSCHIAGSKGKGSTAEMVAAIMATAGHRVGLYTSPHLLHLRQRIRIQGRPIGERAFAEVFETVRRALEADDAEGGAGAPSTFFDIITATAFVAFREAAIEVAVVETGLGGRLDSTNVLLPEVTGITSVEMDHADVLGGTLEEIASEKAGIVKEGVPLILGPVGPEALAPILRKAGEERARVSRVGKDIVISDVTANSQGSRFHLRTPAGSLEALRIPLLGAGQVENAAVAVGLAEAWREAGGLDVPEKAIRDGLSRARLPGRIQVLREEPTVVVDGAHTRSSARMLGGVLREVMSHRRMILVLGILGDKEVDAILDELVPLSQEVVVTQPPSARALSTDDLGRRVRERFPWAIVYGYSDPVVAFREALLLARPDDLVCIAGSMYLAGEALRSFGSET